MDHFISSTLDKLGLYRSWIRYFGYYIEEEDNLQAKKLFNDILIISFILWISFFLFCEILSWFGVLADVCAEIKERRNMKKVEEKGKFEKDKKKKN